jgi:hypothetical protein
MEGGVLAEKMVQLVRWDLWGSVVILGHKVQPAGRVPKAWKEASARQVKWAPQARRANRATPVSLGLQDPRACLVRLV